MSMYNEEWKNEYIFYEGINPQYLKNQFLKLSKYEQRYEKDLCEMSMEELQSALTSLNIVSHQARLNYKSMINAYIDWCIKTNKTSRQTNPLRLLSAKDIASKNAYESRMIKSPEQVRELLEIAYPDRVEYPNRTLSSELIFWLFYSGVSRKDIHLLKKDSIDYDKCCIISPTQNNKIYNVFSDVVPLWKNYILVDCLEVQQDRFERTVYKPLQMNEYLFRQHTSKASPNMSYDYFKFNILKTFKQYQEETDIYLLVSIHNIIQSGYFYRLYTSQQSDEDIRNQVWREHGNIESKAYVVWNAFLEWRNYFYSV
jgi:hypothetical protein